MIESLTISNTATFGEPAEELTGLSQFNYLFGSNGTGKTTISRIIADQTPYPACSVKWRHGLPLETVVLNRDFVDRNFNQLKGVFTLGEKQKDTLEKLGAVKKELDKENKSLSALRSTLHGEDGTGGKKGELAQNEIEIQEKCWAQKKKYDELQGAFTGYRNSAVKFKDKVIEESQDNDSPLKPLTDLEKRAATLLGEAPTKETSIPEISAAALLENELNPVLKKRVIGRGDIDIAAMINKLGNSDWVRKGRTFYDANSKACPFCQQATTNAFAASLAEYFDQTFEADSKAIGALVSTYTANSSAFQARVKETIAASGKFLDVEKLKAHEALLDQIITANQLMLDKKKNEPSQVVELRSLAGESADIKKLIDAANVQIVEHNSMVDNLDMEKRNLAAQVWRFVCNELELDLSRYRARKSELNRAIASIDKSIEETNGRITAKQYEIRNLEKQTTSIQPAIDGINTILSRFGFDSFKLAMSTDKKSYRLVRHNGDDAQATLSEGEKTFVVFLYFYHLLKGSTSETGITTDRVVVFDDPVSSLDSDVLFIVSSLIREICDDVRHRRGHIQQVFVLTHNIYFHKEVVFNIRRTRGRLNEESFWIVRKLGPVSKVDCHEDNPVKTLYEFLWTEVRKPTPGNIKIENTLRRILEYYFTILGSVATVDICAMFDGQDKLVCRSLFSWVNAGSHHAHDEVYLTPSDTMIQNYLKVFRQIFEKAGHPGHYKMMMGSDFVGEPADESLQISSLADRI
jgi:wobble nucleotide-excising tRNase